MMTRLRKIRNELLTLHRDERGTTALEGIMMLAVGAIVVVALIAFGKIALQFLWDKWKEISGSSVTPNSP